VSTTEATARAPARRDDLADLLGDLGRLETVVQGWDDGPREIVEAYRRAIDALHGEALRRLISAMRSDPAALAAMKEAASDQLIYTVLRHHNLVKPSLNERIEGALRQIRPMLASHGGDVELVRVAPPTIEVRFTGSCDGCAASALTFHAGVKKAVAEACPEITDIVQVKGLASSPDSGVRFVSPFALGAQGRWLAAGALTDIPQGGIRALALDGENIILSRVGVAITCFQDACAHLGYAISGGEVDGGLVTCPHHGFRYDLASGECLTAPEVQLRSHAVRLIGDRVEVRLTT
jgi:nitrite reductase/ring-hydroxylating ferredoxin subunit/Fe-S cluster biogenesis protein NfuA